jgi:ribosomal protein S18 acetylase RimI-like enzyme
MAARHGPHWWRDHPPGQELLAEFTALVAWLQKAHVPLGRHFKEAYEPAEILYLARDLSVRRMGLGDALLAEALAKIVEASERVGIPGIYERFSL